MRSAKIFATILTLLIATHVFAQSPGTTGSGPNSPGITVPGSLSARIPNPLKGCSGNTNGSVCLINLFNSLIDNVLLPLGAVLAILAFIWTGFMFVTAQGNETKLGTAKRALLYVVIGTAILLGARVLGAVIANTIEGLKS